MPHNRHTVSPRNQDANRRADEYLALAAEWQDPFHAPVVESPQGFCVVRDDLLEVGSKARFGDLLIRSIPRDQTITYVAPRFGFAAISIAYLAKRHGRRLVLLMPSCQRISAHQAAAIEMGAVPKFLRIAAMPNLNAAAQRWASRNNGFFIPLGLKHELVTAAIVKVARGLSETWGFDPGYVWTAVSTGVLSRGLQIAWPQAKFYGVCVSRNIQEGERGLAELFSHEREFAQDSLARPPFPSCMNYDAKCWELMVRHGHAGDLMWNVAGEIEPKNLQTYEIDSYREWGDDRDLKA